MINSRGECEECPDKTRSFGDGYQCKADVCEEGVELQDDGTCKGSKPKKCGGR